MATGTVLPPGIAEDDETEIQEMALSAVEEADRAHQVATARRFPRSLTKFVKDLEDMTCMNQLVAEQAMYSIPRAGKQIVGPSVRFAEAAISCWGNVRAGVAPLESDMREGYVIAEGRFYDCEKNVGLAMQVKRRNVGKRDPDGQQVTMAAASSIAFRNAALRGIPQALWGPIFDKAKTVAAGAVESFDKSRAEVVKVLNNMGVTSSRIYSALGIEGMKDIGRDEYIVLRNWITRLQNKEVAIEELFGSPLQEEIEQLMNALKWPPAQRQMSNVNFRNSPQEQLNHLREEARKAGITLTPKEEKPSQTSAPATGAAAQSAQQATQQRSTAEPAASTTQPTEEEYQAVTGQTATQPQTTAPSSSQPPAGNATTASTTSTRRRPPAGGSVNW